MQETDFFERLMSCYCRLDIPEQYLELFKVDQMISYYLADTNNQIVHSFRGKGRCIVEVDITSAFPTICTALFGPDDDFVEKIGRVTDKTARNILIATTLKDTGYLERLNMICKMVILSTIFSLTGSIPVVLELKKDGLIFVVGEDDLEDLKSVLVDRKCGLSDYGKSNELLQLILEEQGFRFHIEIFKSYLRSQKTSVFLSDDGHLRIKGMYKHFPRKLEALVGRLLDGEACDGDLLQIREIYNKKTLDIMIANNLKSMLTEYFMCSNAKVLLRNGKYAEMKPPNLKEIDPKHYLSTFLWPSLVALRSRK